MVVEGKVERLTMDVAEVAQALGISRATAYSLVREGKLPAIRISDRRLVIPKHALELILSGVSKSS